MELKSCENCIHNGICKFYHGEMLRRNYFGKDFIEELKNLEKELGNKCYEYLDKKSLEK